VEIQPEYWQRRNDTLKPRAGLPVRKLMMKGRNIEESPLLTIQLRDLLSPSAAVKGAAWMANQAITR
jgi:hypothetical protein